MTRNIPTAASLIVAFGMLLAPAANAGANGGVFPGVSASAQHMSVEEFSAQSYRILRRAPRVRIYGRRLGPNAVRVCNAHYEQEYRPSGTVIVPRMQCYWRG